MHHCPVTKKRLRKRLGAWRPAVRFHLSRGHVGCAAGLTTSRPEPLYFWGYFVAMNSIWVVIPTAVILRGVLLLTRAVQ